MKSPFSTLTATALVVVGCLLSSPSLAEEPLPRVSLEKFAVGYTSPVAMIPYGEGEEAFLIAEQSGTVTLLSERGGDRGAVFLDLRDRIVDLKEGFDERGLLDIALHPDFEENRLVFLYYSAPLANDAPEKYDHTGHLSAFTVSSDGRTADPDSERILLTIDEPQFNHDGGCLEFGPDGFLYLGVGDGGGANDVGPGHEEGGNGQALNRLLGKILRIDVDSAEPYGIPPSNPFVGKEGRDEIFAWGLRNPWGLSFDNPPGESQSPRLIVADVGQNRFEEINVVRPGGNYGWPRYEGFASFDPAEPNAMEIETGMAGDLQPPVLAYPHASAYGDSPAYGISVTGGHVYRGEAISALQGIYLFADWTTSWAAADGGLFAARTSTETGTDTRWEFGVLPGSTPDALDAPAWIVGFGEDRRGEIYVLAHDASAPTGDGGTIWKLVPARTP